ncbi:hypothetical protein J437_LFUL014595 [Ladona fulva]|uniref:Uncharacterized protein n=1 Tax=Ladona fulva TaxID=123851 RepID=A0A8K0P5J1_LADFU|nr:hypothetical protein J437_LFUL014595 [Ladona fulva]
MKVMVKCFLLLALASVHVSPQQLPPPPPQHQVAILRQINHVNDDGSYTYGYEAADGSFKIETRDVLGTVRGMFGFVDESGQRRRVSYTAGNTTGFQTTRQPMTVEGDNGDLGVPIRVQAPAVPAHFILRPIRPFFDGPRGSRDFLAKQIQHPGSTRSKQGEAGKNESTEETPVTRTTVKTSTSSTETTTENRKGDDVTTTRPSVVQRILRTRPRNNASSRKEESLPVSLRAPLVTPVRQVQSKKIGEEKKDGSGTVDHRQRLVALKVSEESGVPRYVVLPSQILRWRPNANGERRKGQAERNTFHSENIAARARLNESPVDINNPTYPKKQQLNENVADPLPILQLLTRKPIPNVNYQDQQYMPQKNFYTFATTTQRPNLIQPQPLNHFYNQSPIITVPEIIPTMVQQLYAERGLPNESPKFLLQTENPAVKLQPQVHPQQQQQQQSIFPQRILYDAQNRRYDPQYQRSNSFLPNVPMYPYYKRQDLLEILLSYLLMQRNIPENNNPYSYPLPFIPKVSGLPHQEFPSAGSPYPPTGSPYPPTGSPYPPTALFTPYHPQYEQNQHVYRPVPLPKNNLDLQRYIDVRALLRPSVRQQVDVPHPLAPPIVHGNGYDIQYAKSKSKGYLSDLYLNQQSDKINSQQGVVLQPTPYQFQQLVLGNNARNIMPPQQPDFSILTSSPDNSQAKLVTTIVSRTTTEYPTTPENQGLPYGFTKKFRSVEIIPPDTNDSSVKEVKTDS